MFVQIKVFNLAAPKIIMENLYIKGTLKSPTLNFNYQRGLLDISGRSHPEHAITIYEPALHWLDEYTQKPQAQTTVNVSLEYFNTSSSKVIFDIFRRLEKLHAAGNKVVVKWHYEEDDEDMKDEGRMFSELVKIPIELVPVKEFDFTF